jgi:DNA-binding Lrp family transcriptional regulator
MASEGRSSDVSISRLDERILLTLAELPGRIAFSGLRRVLDAHPESLSRALRRLEREGLIDRADGGYRALVSPPALDTNASLDLRRLGSVELPIGAPPTSVLARMTGRWFGTLRWVGVVERNGRQLLTWAPRVGGGFVSLCVEAGRLGVYVPVDSVAHDTGEIEAAGYELLVHAVRALRPSEGGSALSMLADRPAPLGALRDN